MSHVFPALSVRIVTITLAVFVSQATAQDAPDSESVIRAAAREFVEAFDRGDAEALAGHFTTDGVYINEEGTRFEGRESIRAEYETLLKNSSDLKFQLEIDSIRLVNANTALEEGRVALTPQPPGAVRVISAYTAVHTLQDGKWLMAHVRDTRVELPPETGQLDDLDWLKGTWVAEGGDARVTITGRWIASNRFFARSHSTTEAGKVTSTAFEVIGVDPSTQQITSWSFTSDGGHSVGLWAPNDRGWIVETAGMTGDGTPTASVKYLAQSDADTLVWKSTQRWLGDSTLPDTGQVTLKRQ